MDPTQTDNTGMVPIFSSLTLCPDSITLLVIGFIIGWLAHGRK